VFLLVPFLVLLDKENIKCSIFSYLSKDNQIWH